MEELRRISGAGKAIADDLHNPGIQNPGRESRDGPRRDCCNLPEIA